MRKLTTSILLAGISCVVIGCSDGNSSVSDADEKPETRVSAAETTDGADDAAGEPANDTDPFAPPLEMNLEEPTPVDEPSTAGELLIGDPAPPVSISKWISGDPIEAFAADRIYVVEFWATWCGPCLASMPHIASLQKEYGDKVTFIGVTAEEEDVVTEFMGQTSRGGELWSEVLTYTIALDEDRGTNAAYMQAAGQNGIPCAFIVGRNGKVEWIGHPAAIDEPLQQVVDGAWDVQKARNRFLAERESEAVMQEYGPKIQAAYEKGDFRTGVSLFEELIAKFPENNEFKRMRFQFLLQGEMFDEANKAAEALVKEANDNARELDQLAWILATAVPGPGPDLDLALSAAKRAEELTQSKDASVLDTLSRVLFTKGNVEDAVAIQRKAIELADPDYRPQFEERLKEYEAALKGNDPNAAPADGSKKEVVEADEVKPADPSAGDVDK